MSPCYQSPSHALLLQVSFSSLIPCPRTPFTSTWNLFSSFWWATLVIYTVFWIEWWHHPTTHTPAPAPGDSPAPAPTGGAGHARRSGGAADCCQVSTYTFLTTNSPDCWERSFLVWTTWREALRSWRGHLIQHWLLPLLLLLAGSPLSTSLILQRWRWVSSRCDSRAPPIFTCFHSCSYSCPWPPPAPVCAPSPASRGWEQRPGWDEGTY